MFTLPRPTRSIVLLVAGLALVPARAPSQPATQPPTPVGQVPPPQTPAVQPVEQPPVFKTDVELVAVDVSVVDTNGHPVRGLTPDDFVLKVDGEVRKISQAEFVAQTASSGPPPSDQYSTNEGAYGGRLIMLVVDEGNIRRGSGNAFVRAAGRVLDDLGPGDRVGLAVIPAGSLIDFTAHFALVRDRLSKITGSAMPPSTHRMTSLTEAINIIERNDQSTIQEVAERECLFHTQDQRRTCRENILYESTLLYEEAKNRSASSLTALRNIFRQLRKVPGTKTLIMISEGLALTPSMANVSWVSAEAIAAKATMYAVRLDDPMPDTAQRRSNPTGGGDDRALMREGLERLVGMARGASFEVIAGANWAFDRLARELTGYYIVAFEADPSERDGKPHQITLSVKRPGVELRSRREFTALPVTNARRADEELLAEALRDPRLMTDILMRVSTYSFPDPGAGGVRVLVNVGLGRGSDELGVKAVAFKLLDAEGTLVASRLEEVELRNSVDHRHVTTVNVPPGTYDLKVVGVDAEGRLGSVEHRFTAALTSASAITVSDLMLGPPSAARRGWLDPALEPRMVTDAMVGYLEVYSKDVARLEGTNVTLEIASQANSAALVQGPLPVAPAKQPERRIAQGQLDIVALPPGEYVARAVVSLQGKPIARVLRPFTFAPSSGLRSRATAGGFAPGFDVAHALRPGITGPFLKQVEVSLSGTESPAITGALTLAREGRFVELPDALSAAAAETTPGVAFLRGLGFYARGELEPAAAQFREAIRASAEFTPATFYLGACYAAGGRDKEAVGAWQTTLASDATAGSPFVYVAAADAYLRLGDWEAALDIAREGATAWPDDDDVRLRMARAYAQGARQGEALAALDPYLERHPTDTDTLFLAMRLVYEAHAVGRPVEGPDADRRRFERYLARYQAAGGPQRPLAAEWLRAMRGSAQ